MPLHQGEPAIDRQRRAGDVGSVRRQQEGDDGGDSASVGLGAGVDAGGSVEGEGDDGDGSASIGLNTGLNLGLSADSDS